MWQTEVTMYSATNLTNLASRLLVPGGLSPLLTVDQMSIFLPTHIPFRQFENIPSLLDVAEQSVCPALYACSVLTHVLSVYSPSGPRGQAVLEGSWLPLTRCGW